MHKAITCTTVLLLIAGPTVLVAQQSGKATGRFGTRTIASEITEMPGGGAMELSHYHQVTFADDASHPMNNQTADCVGLFLTSPEGNPVSASGSCFGKDAEGDGLSFWWRMDKAGTADCPNLCGSFGYFAGYGKFKSVSGTGTWRVTAPFPDGNLGVWESSFSMR